jgi:Domain of unknown function (DUF3560)
VTITIRHTRQQGTLVFGTTRGDGAGKILHPYPLNFRGSEWLPVDAKLGDPFWYLPHSRRSRAAKWKINRAKEQLEAQGFTVEVIIDDVTPAKGFDDLEAERYERAESRADAYGDRAGTAMATSDRIRAENEQTYDALNGTPVLVDHYSARRHRNLLDRLWKREGKAWRLYDKAVYWHQRQISAERYQHHREAVGTTRRRIKEREKRLRQIGREMEGKVSEHEQAVYAAEVVELIEEISYWDMILEKSGAKLWSKADFVVGDFVRGEFKSWHEVGRVNAQSLSVAGRFEIGPIHTLAMQQDASRWSPATGTLAYDKVSGRLSAAEARERFPAAFAQSLDDEAPPERPKKKRGKVKLEHHSGAARELWYFSVGGQDYMAAWPQPEGWYSRGTVEPITGEIAPVRILKLGGLGHPNEPIGVELPVPSPLRYVEEVHNIVRAYVEGFAKEQAATAK